MEHLLEQQYARSHFRSVFVGSHENTDPPHGRRLLRPCSTRIGEASQPSKAEKSPPPHSIISSARARSVGGIVGASESGAVEEDLVLRLAWRLANRLRQGKSAPPPPKACALAAPCPFGGRRVLMIWP